MAVAIDITLVVMMKAANVVGVVAYFTRVLACCMRCSQKS
jgi:hypothetical protein